jgi:hypothetical protein
VVSHPMRHMRTARDAARPAVMMLFAGFARSSRPRLVRSRPRGADLSATGVWGNTLSVRLAG